MRFLRGKAGALASSSSMLFGLLLGCDRSPSTDGHATHGATESATATTATPGCASQAESYAVASRSQLQVDASASAKLSTKGDTCRLAWNVPSDTRAEGVGFRSGNSLVIGWGGGPEYGVIVYAIDGGTLRGSEAENDFLHLQPEDLAGPPGLDGDYTITHAVNAQGVPYTGHVKITPTGATYSLAWEVDCECKKGPRHHSYVGIGVKDGDKLVAAWGTPGAALGVADYKVADGRRLDGVWATLGAKDLSAEKLVAK